MIPILADLLGKDSPIGQIVGKLLDFIPDPQKKAEAQQKWLEEIDKQQQIIVSALSAIDQKQADINAEEAKSINWFIASARPALMWVFVLSFTWQYVLLPISSFILVVFHHPIVLPTLDMSVMMPVLVGLLGLSTQRTIEKLNNAQGNH
jgi:hypothetical protein